MIIGVIGLFSLADKLVLVVVVPKKIAHLQAIVVWGGKIQKV